ncbi:MAG: hypothetical protein QOH86_224 [Sphingomonadales bacterium]|nr:hypothetical protein [Sphingomonadales bacterium]
MSGDPGDLSGRWNGFYSYRRGGSCAFEAELRDHGGALVGVSYEIAEFGPAPGSTLSASLHGRRSGRAVRFAKTYDEVALAHYSIHYTGTLAPDGNEIEGQWRVAGDHGTFLMVRRGGTGAEEEAKAGETVKA